MMDRWSTVVEGSDARRRALAPGTACGSDTGIAVRLPRRRRGAPSSPLYRHRRRAGV